jgi:CSLREA domain-containing protein
MSSLGERVLKIAVMALMFFAVVPAQAKTFTVNSTTDAVASNPAGGVCETAPGNGICTLRAAIQVANTLPGPDTIILPSGTYTLTIPGQGEDAAAAGDLDITDDLTITGAGAATTIIQGCVVTAPAVSCAAVDRIFHVDPSAKLISVTISAVTIQNGTTILISFVNPDGGAILVGGAAILGVPQPSGSLTLINSVVRNSHSVRDGGAIAVSAATLTLVNTTVSSNTGGFNAGGINMDRSKVTLTNSTVSDNVSSSAGGGFFESVNTSQLAINNSTISNNRSGAGGGIFRDRGTMNITNSTITGNAGPNSAGGIFNSASNDGPVILNNVTITNNSAISNGGGISNGGIMTVMNSIIAGNSAFINPQTGGGQDCFGTITSGGHNLIQSLTGCTVTGDTASNITGKPALFGLLADNGGPTQTQALLGGSPAIGNGNPAVPGSGGNACAATDQRGVARPQPVGGICDIGAFEFNGGLGVSGMIPNRAGGSGHILALLYGDSFIPGITVKLRCGPTEIPGFPVNIDATSSVISTSFDLTGVGPTFCDAVATDKNGTVATRIAALTVEKPVAPQLWAQLLARNLVHVGRPATIRVLYGNRGNTDALGVALGITLTKNLSVNTEVQVTRPPAQPGDPAIDWSKITIGTVAKNPDSTFIPLFLPVVPAGFTGVLEFTVTPPVALHGQPYAINATIGPATVADDLTPDPLLILDLVAGAKAYSLRFMNTPLSSAVDPQLTKYFTGVIQNAVSNGINSLNNSQGTIYEVYSLGQMIVGGAGNGAGALPPGPGAGGTGDGGGGDGASDPGDDPPDCDDLGWCDEPPPPDPSPDKCTEWPPSNCSGSGGGGGLSGAIDPNDKVGPIGFTPSRFITNAVPLAYSVYFENEATATAAAQQVVVTDQLDITKVDLSSFSFGPVAFGVHTVAPPPGLTAFTRDVDLRPAQNLIARVAAKLDTTTGLITWTFSSLDPITLLPTQDAVAGFLPPNTNPPAGEGNMVFTVNADSSLTTGSLINNQARVVFDTNAPILTPVWSNAIDTTAPSSHVVALPATESTNTFNVSWTGTDVGAGVGLFTLFVSEDQGAFTPLVTITGTSTSFTGKTGSTYSFFSVATDLVGNVESKPQVAEATTKVAPSDAIPPLTAAAASPQPNANGWNNTNVTVTLAARDNPGGSGVKQITFAFSGAQTGGATVAGNTAMVTVSAEGVTTLSYFATDNAGNNEATQSLTLRIDKTPPLAPTALVVPAPNTNGWNNSASVTVSFQSNGDPGAQASGVASCTGPTTLTSETAGTSASGTCVDAAGNSSGVTTALVKIDRTPPELAASCAPLLRGPNVTGVDPLSGIDSVTLASNTVQRGGGDDAIQQQGFTVLDKAGNTLAAVFNVKGEDGESQFSLASLSYNRAIATPETNTLGCESEADDHSGGLRELKQRLSLPAQNFAVEARFSAERNQTEITVRHGGTEEKSVRPGLVFLNLTTKGGILGFTF